MNTESMTTDKREGATAATLRPYQKHDAREIARLWRRHRCVLLVAFMGTGKTVTAAETARQIIAGGGRLLILVHRGEILKQTLAKLIRVGLPASEIGIIWGDHAGLNVAAPVQLASVQTITRRETIAGITHVIVDEAHHAHAESWKSVLAAYPEAKILGLTATPERLDGKPLGDFFDEMVLSERSETLIENDWLAKPEIWTREDGWRPEKMKKRGGDYAAEDAARAMSGSTIVGGIPAAYKKHGRGLPAVLFAATKAQARTLALAFERAGVKADTLFGEDTESERDAKLARLRSGAVKVLCTCDVLGEGWDYDGCRVVIMARPTASLARYLQWAGRAMRPGGPSIILDHAGNYYAHGAPWEDQEWDLWRKRPESSSRSDANVDAHGRVTFEPREVRGVLKLAIHIERQKVCAGWEGSCPKGEKPPIWVFSRSRIDARNGKPWRCRSCANRMWQASLTPEQRSEASRKSREWQASLTPEQRSERARKMNASFTPEQRSEWARKALEANASLTPEQRSEAARKAWASRRRGPDPAVPPGRARRAP